MVRTISKIGNSYGLIFDAKLRELSGLKPGDKVNVTIHEGGVIVVTPLSPVVGTNQARMRAEKLIKANSRLFRRLA